MAASPIFIGGTAVLALFAGHIWLLGRLSDKWSARARAVEAANPGQASLKAERLVRRLGEMVLRGVQAFAWLSGLLVLPLLLVIVYDGSWALMPLAVALTLLSAAIHIWTAGTLAALRGGVS